MQKEKSVKIRSFLFCQGDPWALETTDLVGSNHRPYSLQFFSSLPCSWWLFFELYTIQYTDTTRVWYTKMPCGICCSISLSFNMEMSAAVLEGATMGLFLCLLLLSVVLSPRKCFIAICSTIHCSSWGCCCCRYIFIWRVFQLISLFC